MPSFVHLSEGLKLRVCGFLDLRSLFDFRQTSRPHLEVVATELQGRLTAHIGTFVPHPQVLLEKLTAYGGVVGGEVALAFLLRHTDFTPTSLDLYLPVGLESWIRFENHLIYDQWAIPERGFPLLQTQPLSRLVRKPSPGRGIRTAARFSLNMGSPEHVVERTVNLFRSQSSDPLVPISQGRATHLLAYANLDHLGCGYPLLLLNHRSLMGTGPRDENELISLDIARGIDFGLSATKWPDISLIACGAPQWLCPSQTRSFNDCGSLYARS
ncbi:hypothetical protein OH76DRAFT_1358300 [Lentinus brumalis]|uniref:Uncharacterized protein n=1 Tax=Lentinus brumalis TaxID=2498619 RepID=A0A371CY56_9APHY|nr:hypothetical protein OH76DRAFT_1358300 [Polyporus brumalis]